MGHRVSNDILAGAVQQFGVSPQFQFFRPPVPHRGILLAAFKIGVKDDVLDDIEQVKGLHRAQRLATVEPCQCQGFVDQMIKPANITLHAPGERAAACGGHLDQTNRCAQSGKRGSNFVRDIMEKPVSTFRQRLQTLCGKIEIVTQIADFAV